MLYKNVNNLTQKQMYSAKKKMLPTTQKYKQLHKMWTTMQKVNKFTTNVGG